MLDEDLGLDVLFVVPGREDGAALHQFVDTLPMLGILGDKQDALEVLVPEFDQQLVVDQCVQEQGDYLVEEGHHFEEVFAVLLVLDLLLAHHLDLEVDPQVHLSGFLFLDPVDLLVDEDVTEVGELVPDSF